MGSAIATSYMMLGKTGLGVGHERVLARAQAARRGLAAAGPALRPHRGGLHAVRVRVALGVRHEALGLLPDFVFCFVVAVVENR